MQQNYRWETGGVWAAQAPGAVQALPSSAAKLRQAAIERAGPAWSPCSNAKVFNPLSPLSVHLTFWWIRIGTCVHLALSTWLNASLNWSLCWRNLVFAQSTSWDVNDCSVSNEWLQFFLSEWYKIVFCALSFFQLSDFFTCLMYLPSPYCRSVFCLWLVLSICPAALSMYIS